MSIYELLGRADVALFDRIPVNPRRKIQQVAAVGIAGYVFADELIAGVRDAVRSAAGETAAYWDHAQEIIETQNRQS